MGRCAAIVLALATCGRSVSQQEATCIIAGQKICFFGDSNTRGAGVGRDASPTFLPRRAPRAAGAVRRRFDA